MNTARLLSEAAAKHAQRPAIAVGTEAVLTYEQLAQRVAALAGWLVERTPGGGVVAIAADNCIEYLELLFAAWHAGMAVAPMNARLSSEELAYMVEDCGAAVLFAGADKAQALRDRLSGVEVIVPGTEIYAEHLSEPRISPRDCAAHATAWIFYTSGTTGKPKGAMITHANLAAMTRAYSSDVDCLDRQDALLHLAPTSHASGLFALSFIGVGANNVLPVQGRFHADELITLADHYPSLTFFLPPPILRRIGEMGLKGRINAGHIRSVLVGAAPIAASDLRRAVDVFGPRLWNGYGQGESPCTITAMSKAMIDRAIRNGDEHRLASVGIAREGIELRIVDDAGNAVAAGTPGEVLARGATVMAGYLNLPEATAATLEDGWLHTGDVGALDEEGYLTLIDRKKDVIFSGGLNVYAREVEDVLSSNEVVADVAVIGIPDPEWGEAVMAVVVCAPGTEPDEMLLDAHCLERVARFKRPKHYRFVDALPRNTGGKILKRELRDRYGTGQQS